MFRNKQIPPSIFIESLKKKIRDVDVGAVKKLLDEAALNRYEINFNDPKTKYTPLHFAVTRATEGHELHMLEIIKALKEAGGDVNKVANDSFSTTPLHTACRRGLTSTTTWLIENRANKDAKDNSNQTPMDYLEKQIISTGDHMDDEIRKRLEDVKTALSLKSPDNNFISSKTVAQVWKFGLFATVLLGGAMAIRAEIYRRYEV